MVLELRPDMDEASCLQVSVPPLEAGLLQVTFDDIRRLPADEVVSRELTVSFKSHCLC